MYPQKSTTASQDNDGRASRRWAVWFLSQTISSHAFQTQGAVSSIHDDDPAIRIRGERLDEDPSHEVAAADDEYVLHETVRLILPIRYAPAMRHPGSLPG